MLTSMKRRADANEYAVRKRERAARKPLKRERESTEPEEDEISPRDALLKEICGARTSLRPSKTIETYAPVIIETNTDPVNETTNSPRKALLKEICGPRTSLRPCKTIETYAPAVILENNTNPVNSTTNTRGTLLRAIRAPHSLRPTQTVEKHAPVVPDDALLRSIRAAPAKVALRPTRVTNSPSSAYEGTTRRALLQAIRTPPRLQPTQTVKKLTPVVVEEVHKAGLSGSLLHAIHARPALRLTQTVVKHQPVILSTWSGPVGPAVAAHAA